MILYFVVFQQIHGMDNSTVYGGGIYLIGEADMESFGKDELRHGFLLSCRHYLCLHWEASMNMRTQILASYTISPLMCEILIQKNI